ncbi:UDP-N-acetylmuramoyl-tripeptide--D-alanyl-D-alanine ligase [Vreelandella alkaliphila]|uniref:UDP-N-acetylmuramoyl-tripeptide--D-alanyl-D- alanine ligase n=1 Tax=Vreelandella alkaliphila TaxID=272774 RepID=UPI003FD8A98D
MQLSAHNLENITGGVWSLDHVSNYDAVTLSFNYLHSNEYPIKEGALVIPRGQTTFRHGTPTKVIDKSQGNVLGYMVDESFDTSRISKPFLKVKNVSKALLSLARFSRNNFSGKVIAITGSVGKTTTKKMLYESFSRSQKIFYEGGTGNISSAINRQIVNLADEDLAVLEICSAALPRSSVLAKPDVAIITALAPAHLSDLVSLKGVASKKSTIFDGLSPDGWAIINRDIPYFEDVYSYAIKITKNVVTYGEHPSSDLLLSDYFPDEGKVVVTYKNESFDYFLKARGKHFAINSLACLLAADVLGYDFKRFSTELVNFFPEARRGDLIEIKVGVGVATVIDETYNANPVSMKSALYNLSEISLVEGASKIAVLGDMASLGEQEVFYHEELFSSVVSSGADKVFLVGDRMLHLWNILPESLKGGYAKDSSEVCSMISGCIAENDVIMVKGSNSMKMNKVVKFLVK